MLSVAVRCTDMGCAVRSAAPIPIADYRNARGEMAVALLRDLAAGAVPVGASWRSYYSARLARMERWLAAFPTTARQAGPAAPFAPPSASLSGSARYGSAR